MTSKHVQKAFNKAVDAVMEDAPQPNYYKRKQNLRDKILEFGRLERIIGCEVERYGEANYENNNRCQEILEEISSDLNGIAELLGARNL